MTKPQFRRLATSIREGNILTTTARASIATGDFEGFSVPVETFDERPYDGWFHPSSQATWTARQLFYYLTEPDKLEAEPFDVSSVLAVTAGKFWHEFFQRLFIQKGILEQAEVPLSDKEHNRRGHMDGRLANGEGLEIKTMNDFKITQMESAQSIREKKPEYYAQAQDYLDMSGLPAMRFFIVSLSWPFDFREIKVPADPAFQQAQRDKYAEAIDCARRGVVPGACCALGSKQAKNCFARYVCPIGGSK